jgi:multidrug resistance protein
MAEFDCSRIVATLGLSLFVMGLGLGPMFLGPLSEFFGRRPIYIASFTMFLIWVIPSAVARNIQTMLIARFFDGLAGSAFLSVAGGTVGDMFNREQLQAPMMIYTASPFIGPSVGPLIGGFINQNTTWRWTFYVILIWSGFMLAIITAFVPETYHPVMLRNKARKIRKETGDERWKAPLEKSNKTISKTISLSLIRPFQLLLLEPMCLNLCLFSAILLGVLYLFFGAFALIFENNHGFTISQVGLAFLGILVGMISGILTDPIWHKNYVRLVRNREAAGGEPGGSEPEYRLPPAILGAPLVTIGLFWFGWTTYASVHWILPIIGSAIFGMG